MRGGTLSCRRNKIDNNCITVSCVDYQKGKYNSESKTECNAQRDVGWEKFWDTEANCHYYYNHSTGEATWIKPPGFGGGYRKRASRFSKKRTHRRTRSNKR